MEVLGGDEVLAEELAADDDTVDLDQRPVGLVVECDLSDRGDHKRVGDAEEEREDHDRDDGGAELTNEGLHVSWLPVR